MRAIVLGYHTLGCVGLEALLAHGYEVAAVVTHRDDPGEEVWWESLADKARERDIPVIVPTGAEDPAIRAAVAAAAPDFLFSFYFRWMVPPDVLALARRGALNLHGSLLPRYRGRAPVNWVLVHGERETGVSLHYMVAKPDAGDLVDREAVPIDELDTAFTLYGKLAAAARRLLDRALPALAAGTAAAAPLDLAAGSYFGGRKPADGRIDWSRPAPALFDLVRAVTHPYPGAFTTWGGRTLHVWWALPVAAPPAGGPAPPGSVLAVDRDGVTVAAGEGALRLVTVQLAGQPELPACAFALAASIAPGARFGGADEEAPA
jgi:UDP-4-amino-4-deoxy-L-arabinose formyltransferase / UDP-glucuronic acid dehydrogenase (UDP-4-keto-hexauronic acid decarboxylating)